MACKLGKRAVIAIAAKQSSLCQVVNDILDRHVALLLAMTSALVFSAFLRLCVERFSNA